MQTTGCFLDVVQGERLVFTDAFAEGFMPRAEAFVTSAVELSDADGGGTDIVWSARHATPEAKARHIERGMERGWNAPSISSMFWRGPSLPLRLQKEINRG